MTTSREKEWRVSDLADYIIEHKYKKTTAELLQYTRTSYGVKDKTAYNYLKEAYDYLIEIQLGNKFDHTKEFIERMDDIYKKALDKEAVDKDGETVETPDLNAAIKAALAKIERLQGKPTQKTENKTDVTVSAMDPILDALSSDEKES